VAYVIPASGTLLLVDGIAIVRGAKRPGPARRFYEFVTTRESLLFAADSLMRIRRAVTSQPSGCRRGSARRCRG
jgi:iron(III) transport system substrate-binding protein